MIERYEQRAAAHAERRDVELGLSRRISRLRLATFIPGAACIVWALARDFSLPVVIVGIALLLAFAALVVWHARVEERAAWYDALHLVNRHALARIARAWDLLPSAEQPTVMASLRRVGDPPHLPGGSVLERHPFAVDLDLFGRASLMQWLGPAATASGTETLERWLLQPTKPAEIVMRQEAVRALAPAADWREELSGFGRLTAGVRRAEVDQFLNWAESPGPFSSARLRLLQVITLLLLASTWLLITLHATGIITVGLWLLPVAAGVVLSFVTAPKVHGEFQRAGAGQDAFSRYAALFAHAVAVPADTAQLRSIRARLAVAGTTAPERMRQLNRILGFSKLASSAGIFHFVIQAMTLWDLHVFFALNRWRRHVGRGVRGWMEAIGELDALSAFAQVRADNHDWCFPELIESPDSSERRLIAKRLGHPLINDDRRVGNDVDVGPPGTLLLITGSNMSGKSTLLRAIGLNVVLAQAGAPVCAASLRMPPLDLETSIRVQDSLEHGLSYFMAALARLKGVVERSRHPPPGYTVMYLLDEILQGTNTAERGLAVRGVARHLLDSGAIGVMTTHDLALAGESPLDNAARLAHFTETVDEHGAMSFDYRLRPGLATSRNALRLMQLIGIDVEPR